MVLAASWVTSPKCLQDRLLALRGGDVRGAEDGRRKEGWSRQAPAALRGVVDFITPAAITSRENGALALEHVENLAIAPSLAPVQLPPLAWCLPSPINRDTARRPSAEGYHAGGRQCP
jgi:hypothetical protein